MGSPTSYDPHAIEARRQAAWRERDAARTPAVQDDLPHLYIKPSAPFTSGNVHIGHVRSYSIGDAYARFRRARGDQVLFNFGFDAFGLPAELGAIDRGIPPSEWVSRCATHMTGQLQRLGFSFDWERTFLSSDPVMYRWSQWLFLTLLEAGLVYRGTGTVDWCDTCQTTLATIQVEDGLCWRCHNPVRLIERPTWYLRISAYVPENDRRLQERADSGKWDEVALASQRFVLGRVDGVEVELNGRGRHEAQRVHAARRGARAGALRADLAQAPRDRRLGGRAPGARAPGGAALGRPAAKLSRRSSDPARRHPPHAARPGRRPAAARADLPRRRRALRRDRRVRHSRGRPHRRGARRADRRSPLKTPARASHPRHPASSRTRCQRPRPAVRYKADDFSISRQRSWGTPIPIVYCEEHGAVPLPKEQLPVALPLDITPTGTGNPLAELRSFVQTTCPLCGGPAERETDTLDCHFDALWLWLPACVPPESREDSLEQILALPDLRHWLPSERVVAGSDSGNFVFDQRIVTKALRDIGPLAFLEDGEPFAGCLFHEMVISDGRKMSKHLGNVVDPDALVERYGADTVRLAVLYAARPQKTLNWSDSAVLRAHRFLTQVWEFAQTRLAASPGARGRRELRLRAPTASPSETRASTCG